MKRHTLQTARTYRTALRLARSEGQGLTPAHLVRFWRQAPGWGYWFSQRAKARRAA